MNATARLLSLAAVYSRHVRRAEATIARQAVNDGKFFHRLHRGHTCTVSRLERALCWFSANWPADLPWPDDIPRPAPPQEERR